jgi:GR25 family glycosyltransferase involved in LPS biosynthesis
MLNNYFEKIFVINLDKRTDRWNECLLESKLYGIDIERISAVDGTTITEKYPSMLKYIPELCYDGQVGCILSHIKVINEAKSQGLKNFLVLEDDFKFNDNFYTNFVNWYMELPKWELLYFGGNHNGIINKVSEHVIRPTQTYTTHAIAIRDTLYDSVLTNLLPITAPVDVSMCVLQNAIDTCYGFYPSLIMQRPSYSDILKRTIDYSWVL